jgi:hypothetical protein
MPFDPAYVQLLDAQFSRTQAWVSAVLSDSLEIQTGPLASNGDVVTATVRFATLPNAPDGSLLGRRLTYTWHDAAHRGSGRSNLPILVAAGTDEDQELYSLAVGRADDRSEDMGIFIASSPIFAPGEPVTFWYNTPGGSAEEVGTFAADSDGAVTLRLKTVGLPQGAYTLIARGYWTEFQALGNFSISGMDLF